MKYEVKKIDVKACVKVFSFLYFSLGLIVSVVSGGLMLIEGHDFAFAASTLAAPVAGFIVGGVMGLVFSWIYNLFAGKFGGLIIKLKDLDNPDH